MPKLPSPENALPSSIPFGWWPCFNVTDETIPGYAHVKFCQTRRDPAASEGSPIFINGTREQINHEVSQELFAGQAYIRVRKPEAEDDAVHQESWFTWEHPILPHQFGLCTRNFPVRALVQAIPPDFRCEVASLCTFDPDNPWVLYDENEGTVPGQQFVVIMMDATDRRSRRPAEPNGEDWRLTVCWIEPLGNSE